MWERESGRGVVGDGGQGQGGAEALQRGNGKDEKQK